MEPAPDAVKELVIWLVEAASSDTTSSTLSSTPEPPQKASPEPKEPAACSESDSSSSSSESEEEAPSSLPAEPQAPPSSQLGTAHPAQEEPVPPEPSPPSGDPPSPPSTTDSDSKDGDEDPHSASDTSDDDKGHVEVEEALGDDDKGEQDEPLKKSQSKSQAPAEDELREPVAEAQVHFRQSLDSLDSGSKSPRNASLDCVEISTQDPEPSFTLRRSATDQSASLQAQAQAQRSPGSEAAMFGASAYHNGNYVGAQSALDLHQRGVGGSELEAELHGRRREAAALAARLERAEQEVARLAAEKAASEERRMGTQLKLDAKSEELAYVSQQLEELEAGGSLNSAAVENLLRQWEEERAEVASLQQANAALHAQIQHIQDTARHDLERQREQLTAAHRSEMMETVEREHQHQAFFDHQRHRLSAKLDEFQVENMRHITAKQRLEKDYDALARQHAGLEKEYQLVMNERGTVLKENEDLAAKVSRLEASRASVASSEGELAEIGRAGLERELGALRHSLQRARETADQARREAQWADGERLKAEQEREALRSMCSTLRAARDEAVSSLTERFHDANGNPSPSHSNDSAIDLAEWDEELIEVEAGDWEPGDLGVELSGGRGQSPASSSPMYVKAVRENGRLHGKLRPHDILVEVNEMSVEKMAAETVADILANARKPRLAIRVRRRRFHPATRMLTFALPPTEPGQPLGISFQTGVFITGLKAPLSSRLDNAALGDRVVLVNDVPVEDKSKEDIQALLSSLAPGGVSLTVLRQAGSSVTPSLSFRSNPSTGLPTPTNASAASSERGGGGQPRPSSGNGNNLATNLLDKLHDKVFGAKAERRPHGPRDASVKTVAQASLPQPLAATDSDSANHSRQPSVKSAEQTAVLSQLDSILSADRSPAAPGSTWPKYRPQPLSLPTEASLRLSTHAPRPPKQHRPSVHSVFAPVEPIRAAKASAQDQRHSPRHQHSASAAQRPRSAYFPPPSPGYDTAQRPGQRSSRPSSSGGSRLAVVGSRHSAYEPGSGAAFRAVSSVPVPPPPPYPHERRGYPKSPEVDYDAVSLSSICSSNYSASLSGQRPPPPPYPQSGAPRARAAQPPPEGLERHVHLHKGHCAEIGIKIAAALNHGVFVNCVTDYSIAQRHGLTRGDQILDVNGVNLRKAGLEVARSVLHGVRPMDSVRIVLKYNPQAFAELPPGSASATSTPRATPNPMPGFASRESSLHSASTQHSREILSSISEQDYGQHQLPAEPRYTTIERRGSQELGMRLCGGNALGILVEAVEAHSLASAANPTPLVPGDQLLELNGSDVRKVTLEQAHFELEKAEAGPLQCLAVHRPGKLHKWAERGGAGDHFFIRVNVERPAETKDEMSLRQGDILFVDKTLVPGSPAAWRAWKLDQAGKRQSSGIIPSKYRLEEELLLRRSGSEISNGDGSSEGGGSRRGTLRRSLKFIRRPSRGKAGGASEALERAWLHSRTNSKESRELLESSLEPPAELYQRVERLPQSRKRPVMVLGPLAYPVLSRLAEEMSRVFVAAVPECVTLPDSQLDSGLGSGAYVDYRKRDATSLLTHTASVKAAIDKGFHCLLDVSLDAVHRLQRHQIYPILVFLDWRKNHKHLKELSGALGEKLSTKAAKELLERHADVPSLMSGVNAHLCTLTVPSNASAQEALRSLCEQLEATVEAEQKKTLWVLSQHPL